MSKKAADKNLSVVHVSPKALKSVKKSGTKTSRRVVIGADALETLGLKIDEMSDNRHKTSLMKAYNTVVQNYDKVIVGYVEKRDALIALQDEVEKQAAIVKDSDNGFPIPAMEVVNRLHNMRKGCNCKKIGSTAAAGCCLTCTCATSQLQCNDLCGCGERCSRPGDKRSASSIIQQRASILKKKVRIEEPAAASSSSPSKAEESSEDEDEEDDEDDSSSDSE